jgi:hypothetical protein
VRFESASVVVEAKSGVVRGAVAMDCGRPLEVDAT